MGRKFALIVGNSEYEDSGLACLVSPGSDVRALAEILEDPGIGGFDEVIPLIDEPEVRVRRGIASLFTRKSSDDLLLLYFSTHGILDENGRLFLAARDTQRDLLKATAISAAFITDEMDNSSSRRQVLILDCCHSGAFARGTKGAPGSSVSTATAFEGNGFGRVVLTATDSTQYAWDGEKVVGGSDLSSSVFTRHLIEGLRTGAADEDDDGRITLDELYEYVYRQVLSETPRQTPGKWSYKQQGNLVVARNPHPGRKVVSLPEPLQKALDSDFLFTREGAVRELGRYLHGSQPGLARAAEQALEKVVAEDDSRKIQRLAAAMLADFRKAREERGESPGEPAERTEPLQSGRPGGSQETVLSADALPVGLLGGVAPREEVAHAPTPVVDTEAVPPPPSVSPPLPKAPARKVTPAAPAGKTRERSGPRAPQSQEAPKLPWTRLLALGTLIVLGVSLILIITRDRGNVDDAVEEVPATTEWSTDALATDLSGQSEESSGPAAETGVDAQLQSKLEAYVGQACPGCTQLMAPTGGRLPAANSIPVEESFNLSPGSPHVVAAVCSPDPCDIDLYLTGTEVEDTTIAPTASIRFLPSSEGIFKVGIRMYKCDAGECSYALGVWTDAAPPAQPP